MAHAEKTEETPLSMERLTVAAASLADQVATAIRAAVRAGTLQPGRLYSAYQMADHLGVSRSPVREALLRLAEAGMVEFERNRGFRIVIPQPRDITEIFHLRLLLEVPAAHGAASDATPELVAALRAGLEEMCRAADEHNETLFMQHDQRLHDVILHTARNARLLRLIDNLRDTTRYLGASTVDRSRTLHDIHAEHVPIVDAIAAADPVAASQAMSRHITRTGKLLLAQAAEAAEDIDADVLWSQIVH